MDDSIAHPGGSAAFWVLPGWKTAVSTIAAALVGVLFIVAGVWKITDPFSAAARLSEARVPAGVALPAACLLGVSETFAGVLLLVPRFRRWGAWLTGLLLVAFVVYIGANYSVLRGEECNCFPLVKRAVGPAFFVGDLLMLALAAMAGIWARPSASRRCAVLMLAAVSVFAAVSYGVNARLRATVVAPERVTVEGKPFPLRQGRVLLYFFDPECLHCDAAARAMAKMSWLDVKILGVPTGQPQFAHDFMRDTGLRAPVAADVDRLRETFSVVTTPYAVALKDGRLRAAISEFEGPEPETGLRRIGFIK